MKAVSQGRWMQHAPGVWLSGTGGIYGIDFLDPGYAVGVHLPIGGMRWCLFNICGTYAVWLEHNPGSNELCPGVC